MTLFKQIDFSLANLIEYIAIGDIGLPDLQRPFVWPNKKVRDLFDSMYQGYPVGYLLLWESGATENARAIGIEEKSRTPNLLVIDGQQRLTSLYAVLRGMPVKRESFREERIQIAFRPLDEKFEVCDAAIRRDPAWIPDISMLWAPETDIFDLVDDYFAGLERTIEGEDRTRIRKGLLKLQNLTSFPFTALQLSAEMGEEQVAEVFVRINSKGKMLNQADFILTLMSVFHDDLRRELEEFCHHCRTPSKGQASPYNHFIEPQPDNLLRVCVGLGFRRARLQHVYSILRGKDLETGEVSEELREKQFLALREAVEFALDLQNWHEYLKTLEDAGYRRGLYVSSLNAILYSYVFYLIGRRDYSLSYRDLSGLIARWFFFVALTGRYTGSPESRMEQDLADLRGVDSAEEFKARLQRKIDASFTSDYWQITLPNELATSSARSPGLFAYYAALALLDAEVLFSSRKVARLMDPTLQARRAALERHHLFPKGFLKKQGITAVRDTNQVANYALLEWPANVEISDQDPAQYFPKFMEGQSPKTQEAWIFWHALPEGWETMPYEKFLRQRRRGIAQVIRTAYERLLDGWSGEYGTPKEQAQTASEGQVQDGAFSGYNAGDHSLTERAFLLLPSETCPLVEELLGEPLEEPDTLQDEIESYLADLEKGAEVPDLDRGRRVGERLLELLASTGDRTEEEHRLLQAAARYFTMDNDVEPDRDSAFGFVDDEEVVAAVEAVL